MENGEEIRLIKLEGFPQELKLKHEGRIMPVHKITKYLNIPSELGNLKFCGTGTFTKDGIEIWKMVKST